MLTTANKQSLNAGIIKEMYIRVIYIVSAFSISRLTKSVLLLCVIESGHQILNCDSLHVLIYYYEALYNYVVTYVSKVKNNNIEVYRH